MITATEKWWSARQVPSKQDANPTETDTTEYKCKALAEDGTYLYAGVDNWIIRYDLDGNALKIGEIAWDAQDIRVSYLEVDGTDLYYVVETTELNIYYQAAHKRAWGTIDLTAVPSYLTPTSEFFKYDKGCRVHSSPTLYHNYRLDDTLHSVGTTRWMVEGIGWGTPAPYRDGGIPRPLSIRATVSTFPATAGATHLHVADRWVEQPSGEAVDHPYSKYIGRYMWAYGVDTTSNAQTQWLGKCTDIIGHKPSGTFIIKFEHPLEYALTPTLWTKAYVYFSADTVGARIPYPNIFVPTYMEVEVNYLVDQLSDRPKEDVRVERKWKNMGPESFFYPGTVANINEGDKLKLEPGYHTFIASITPEQFNNRIGQEEAFGAEVASFYVNFNWIDNKQQYILSEGMVVENKVQDNKYTMCGQNKLTINGAIAKWSDSSNVFCHGNIYLLKDGDDIYVMVNEVKQTVLPDNFTKVRIGRYNGTTFDEVFYDRDAYTASSKYYQNLPTYIGHELAQLNGTVYGLRKKYERNWVNTGLIIGWAAPPQSDRPANWIGGLSANVLLLGDRTDLFPAPSLLKNNVSGKIYRVSESDTLTRQLGTTFAITSWVNKIDNFTVLLLRSIRPMNNWDAPPSTNWWGYTTGTSYADQVKFELLNDDVSSSTGFDIRDEIFYLSGADWVQYKEIYFSNTKALEGKDDNEEIQIAVTDDDWSASPRFQVDKLRVKEVTSVKIGENSLDIEDITNELTINVPDETTVNVKRNQGDEFDETYIYVHPKYLDDEFEVEYDYYPNGELNNVFVHDNDIYYNYSTEEFNLWFKNTEENFAPGVVERSMYSNIVELNDSFYTITEPSYALRQYDKEWSGYLEEYITSRTGWRILGQIALAGDWQLFEWNGAYILGDESYDNLGDLEDIISITKTNIVPFDVVKVIYRNGVYKTSDDDDNIYSVSAGLISDDDDNIYSVSSGLISDYQHAKILGDSILQFYKDYSMQYSVLLAEYRHDIRFNDVFNFNGVVAKVVEIELIASGETKLVLYELPNSIKRALNNSR